MQRDFPTLPILGLRVHRLTPDDQHAILDLCRRCSAFFELIQGEPPSEETAREMFDDGAPGAPDAKSVVLSIHRDSTLIALAELVDGYPKAGEWYVGLLLVDPAERRHGLGHAIWTDLEPWIRSQGAAAVSLVVQQQNPGALRFWQSCGFTVEGESPQVLPKITNRVWLLRKALTAG